MKTGDKIDHLAGIDLAVSLGDRVSVGAPLATLSKAGSPDGLEQAAAELLKAFSFSSGAPQSRELILERI